LAMARSNFQMEVSTKACSKMARGADKAK
jgi:hypothetical protein